MDHQKSLLLPVAVRCKFLFLFLAGVMLEIVPIEVALLVWLNAFSKFYYKTCRDLGNFAGDIHGSMKSEHVVISCGARE
jgi:tetrahydromethanopterin S-methyltransferase subunit C